MLICICYTDQDKYIWGLICLESIAYNVLKLYEEKGVDTSQCFE